MAQYLNGQFVQMVRKQYPDVFYLKIDVEAPQDILMGLSRLGYTQENDSGEDWLDEEFLETKPLQLVVAGMSLYEDEEFDYKDQLTSLGVRSPEEVEHKSLKEMLLLFETQLGSQVLKLNNAEDYESTLIYLTPHGTPIAFSNKVRCLMLSGLTEDEAYKTALDPIDLELYYEIGYGLFAVESESVEGGAICSPYSGKELEEAEEELENGSEIEGTSRGEGFGVINALDESHVKIAYLLKSKLDGIVRQSLINFLGRNKNHVIIPEHDNGSYGLSMLDMGYQTFYFSTMSFNGCKIQFSGINEDFEQIKIDEDSLPDNGMLYLYDYLITGDY